MRGVKGGKRSQLLQSGVIIICGVKGGERSQLLQSGIIIMCGVKGGERSQLLQSGIIIMEEKVGYCKVKGGGNVASQQSIAKWNNNNNMWG